MTLDKIDPRYEYAPDVAPSDGLRSTVYDKTHGILFLTSVAQIERVKEGDYLVTMRAKSIGDLDADAPAPEPVDPPVEPTPVDPPPDPDPVTPDPDPVTTPPIVSGSDIQAAIKKAAAGDTVSVAPGSYPKLVIDGIADGVTIVAEDPRKAVIDTIVFGAAKRTVLKDLAVMAAGDRTNVGVKEYAVIGYGQESGIILDGLLIQAHADSPGYDGWTEAQWMKRLLGAALLTGPNCVYRNCRAVGVRFGFGHSGARSSADGLQVEGFSGDAFRATQSGQVWHNIYCGDAIQLKDGNHCDAMQAFLLNLLLNGLTVQDALFLEWVTRADNPLRAQMQGLSLFNGPYANVIAKGIRVASTAGHGISFNAVDVGLIEDCHLRSADGSSGDQRFPWIKTTGSPKVLVRNCTAGQFNVEGQVSRPAVDYSTPWNRPAPLF